MGMFTNYHNIADNYVPNNLIKAYPTKCVPTKLDPVEASKPYEDYNAKGDLCGYFWRYGESINLEFNLDGEITVESDAIILTVAGAVPSTVGAKINQRAYNIADLKSWTYNNSVDHWVEDNEFTYPQDSEKSVFMDATTFLSDKNVKVTFYDFRHYPVHEQTFAGATKIIIQITPELSKKFNKGIYYCTVEVFNPFISMKVFDTTDGHLLVK